MIATIHGKQFEVAEQPADFWGWVAKGNYDNEWKVLSKFVHPEHTFVDLGAWVGSHSLYASTLCKRVVSVEPDPVAFEILSQNTKPTSIELHRLAITDSNSSITLGSGLLGASTTRACKDEGHGIGAWVEGQTFDVPCMTLRSFIETTNIQDPMFIKIDVEGSEEKILADFELFQEHKPAMYVEMHPWWWKDQTTTWEHIQKIAALYKHVTNVLMQPIDFQWQKPGAIIFTEG